MTDAFLWDAGTENERFTEWRETKQILTEIHKEIVKDNRSLIYSHKISMFVESDILRRLIIYGKMSNYQSNVQFQVKWFHKWLCMSKFS